MDKSTFASLKSLASPPVGVKDVLSAFFLLLGYSQSDALNWRSCQMILAKRNDLISKTNNFDPVYCTLSTAMESEKLLDKYSVETIRKVDLSASQVYIWSLASPPVGVKDVLSAFFLLLGCNQSDALNWRSCQKILAKTNDIISKANNFDPLYCTLSAAMESEKILHKYSVESIRNVDFNAGKVYIWTKSMIEKVKSSGGLKS